MCAPHTHSLGFHIIRQNMSERRKPVRALFRLSFIINRDLNLVEVCQFKDLWTDLVYYEGERARRSLR